MHNGLVTFVKQTVNRQIFFCFLPMAARTSAFAASVACARRVLCTREHATSSIHALSGTRLDGTPLKFDSLAGKPFLLLNVASE